MDNSIMDNNVYDTNKVYIVDEMMGRGKSSAAINYINSSEDERFIIITPYLDEVERYKTKCPLHHFKEPIQKRGSKLNDVKDLIKNGNNIVSTHALFQRFDEEVISLCKVFNYTLIMDEVAEVVQPYDITEDDINILLELYCDVDSKGKLIWREEEQDYRGKFSEVKNLCNIGGLTIVRNKVLMWLFPIQTFNAFDKIFILTYLFSAQIQKYYYDYYDINYSYLYINGDSVDNYQFSNKIDSAQIRYPYDKLIHILENEKMNAVGDYKTALSRSWYDKYKGSQLIKQLQNNVVNFFRNIRNDISKDNIWTTFKDYKSALSGKGYTRGFIPINMRATNAYKERTSLAYLVNIYLNPMVKGFFQDHGIDVDEDGYALSEMLQWIWRSAIRDGKEIFIYVPSRRMRELLNDWIQHNSLM